MPTVKSNAAASVDTGSQVELVNIERAPTRQHKHNFVQLRVHVPEGTNRVPVPLGKLGVNRAVSVQPRALEVPYRVAWDGDLLEPVLVFDEWPETPDGLLVEVEVWGK